MTQDMHSMALVVTTAAEAATPPSNVGPSSLLDGIAFLDDASRPTAPPIPGVTPAQRAQGRRLSQYHRHQLAELAAVRSALARFVAGSGTIEALSDGMASMSMIENYRGFGNLCGRQCQFLRLHHDIEEHSLYPTLRQNAGLRPILDRLSAEHRTVHGLLERIQAIVHVLARDPKEEQVLALKTIYEIFERVVISHFGYEERELEEAIGYYDAI